MTWTGTWKRGTVRRPALRAAALVAAFAVLAGCGAGKYFSRMMGGDEPAGEFGSADPAAVADEAAFRRALAEHTAKAYDAYLKKYPRGRFVRRGRYWLERLLYFDAATSRDPGAMKRFLRRFPRSRYATTAEANLQRTDFEAVREKDTVAAYEAFLQRHKSAKSEWTAAAFQRVERLTLDRAKAERSAKLLERFLFDFPQSPYRAEARKALRKVEFEDAVRSNHGARWRAFLQKYPGTPEAAAMEKHIESEALRGAERSGRISALEAYLKRYPNSPHKRRILSAIALMVRERNREAYRWVRVENAELEVFRPRKCPKCPAELRINGSLVSTDPDFAFDLVLEATLGKGREVCCRTRHRVKALRPGERRPFSFAVSGKKPPLTGPPPAFRVRVVKGTAFHDSRSSRQLEVQGLAGSQGKADRFAPEKVPSLYRGKSK